MLNKKNTARSVLLATAAFAISGCGTAPPSYAPTPTPPEETALIKQYSPMAELDTGNLYYQGEPPPNIAPVDKKTDDLGDIVFIDTKSAIRKYGETRIRQHVVKDVKLCARVTLRKIFLAERMRSTDEAEAYFKKVREWRKVADKVPFVGFLAGTGLSAAKYGGPYGWIYGVGTALPGITDQAIYNVVLDENDVNISLHLMDKREWYGDMTLWLDSMGDWCPAFMSWVERHGSIRSSDQSSFDAEQGPASMVDPADTSATIRRRRHQ